jgi:hypothetical protein
MTIVSCCGDPQHGQTALGPTRRSGDRELHYGPEDATPLVVNHTDRGGRLLGPYGSSCKGPPDFPAGSAEKYGKTTAAAATQWDRTQSQAAVSRKRE